MFDSLMLTVILLILIAVLGVLYYMLKYNSNFLKQIQSIKGIQFNTLDIGEEAPLFRVFDNNGERVVSKQYFFSNKNTLILFVNSKCPICKSILENISMVKGNYDLDIMVINNDESLDDSLLKKLVNSSIVYIRSNFVATAYHVYTTPMAVLVEDGKIKQYSKITDLNILNNLLIAENKKEIS